MLARAKDGILQVRSVDGAFEREVALDGLHAITSLRIDPAGRRIALTAATDAGRAPTSTRAGAETFVSSLSTSSQASADVSPRTTRTTDSGGPTLRAWRTTRAVVPRSFA